MTIATLLTDYVTPIFNAVMDMLAEIATTVTGNPLILLFVLIPVIFLGVNMFRRLLNL